MNRDELYKVFKDMGKLDIFEELERKRDEYIKQHDVGFYVSDIKTKFVSTKKDCVNYDWELNYDEITGIAYGNEIIIEDEFFIIFLRGDKKPIYFIMPGEFSEELQGFEEFINKLKNRLGFEPIKPECDTTILAYPKNLRGEKLYENRNDSTKSFIHAIGRKFGFKREMTGIVREELKKELKMKK